jgi:hypothetical protein
MIILLSDLGKVNDQIPRKLPHQNSIYIYCFPIQTDLLPLYIELLTLIISSEDQKQVCNFLNTSNPVISMHWNTFIAQCVHILTIWVMVMKTSIFWDMPCSPLRVNRRVGDTRRLHLQGSRINEARNQHEGRNKQSQIHSGSYSWFCTAKTSGINTRS